MRRTLLLPILLLTAACLPVSGPSSQRAVVVVALPERTSATCVTFTEPELTGVQLLERAGLNLGLDAGNAAGVLVCAIEGTGCDFPSEKCFCQCSGGGSCAYWAYFNQTADGEWTYAPLGASGRRVHDGDVDLWAWLDSRGVGEFDADALPVVSFNEICQ